MRWTTRILPATLAMALAFGIPAYAQQDHAAHHSDQDGVSPRGEMAQGHAGAKGEGMMHDGMMSGGMTGSMMDSPGMLLRHRDALGIDDSQAERLEALREEMMDARERVSGQALEVLTDEQRSRLEEMRSMHAGMMSGGGMGAMMGGGPDGMAGMDACPMRGDATPSGKTR